MNYHEARDTVLKLIDRYSTAGSAIALSYNNQADFVMKIPALLDDALTTITATVGKLLRTVPLRDLLWEEMDGMRVYTLPEDCMRLWMPQVAGAWLPDESRLALPKGTGEDIRITYYRRPRLLGDAPADDTPLDGTAEMQMAIPYYAAACLMLHEDDFAYKALLAEWERHLGRLAALPRAEIGITEDAYGGEYER